jgi:hypothetical protein
MDEKKRMPTPRQGQAPRETICADQDTTSTRDGTMVNLAQAAHFLSLLEPEGFFTFQTFDDRQDKRPELNGIYHGTLDEHATQLIELNKAGAGIFVCVNATDGEGRKGENVTAVRGVFADLDNPDVDHARQLGELPEGFRPTIIVESSPEKHHAYWLTETPGELALAEFKSLQQGLARWLGSDAQVCDLPRVMRLPGFLHNKTEPYGSRLLHEGERLIGDAIRAALQPHLESQVQPREPMADHPACPLGVNAHPYARRALESAVKVVQSAQDGNRNNTLNREAHGVFGLVKGGHLDMRESGRALADAAKGAGLSANETRTTLGSAWTAAKPREIGGNAPLADFAGESLHCLAQRMERVRTAIARIEEDPGAPFERDILDNIRAIRQESSADWQRIRAEAKKAGVLVGELDKSTLTLASNEGGDSNELFPPVEPWPEPVDGAALVRELSEVLQRYVVCQAEAADAAALWITFTWFIDEVHVAPIANITAPLPNCGKSTLLEFIETFSCQPLKCDGISAAALFRSMDKWQPTLLVDEVDTFLRDNEDARGVLNSGHTRNGFIIRVVGDDHEPKRFSTWGAKALCGIGALASTLASRSIRLELRRKLPHETVENIRFMPGEMSHRIRRQLARLQDDMAETVRDARPAPIPGLSNRAADNWEPLQQIAQAIGGEWSERLKVVAMTITDMDDEGMAPDIGVELLKDIKAVFDDRGSDRIFTAELLPALWENCEAPWSTWNRGKPITDRQVAKKLSGFGIKSKDMRKGADRKKGYVLSDFRDTFERYLSSGPPNLSVTTRQPSNHEWCSEISSATGGGYVADINRRQPSNHAGCNGVTDKFTPRDTERDAGRINGSDNVGRYSSGSRVPTTRPGGRPSDDEWLN